MGFGYEIPANQVGKLKMLWVMGEYGLYHTSVIRELTVVSELSEFLILGGSLWPQFSETGLG